ncbi:MAG TPA: hypothetical protein VJ813_18660 [Vicinamibacterales bacterium]|nr:hypothetical protein [Vicinamibacterales bacterium]
MRGFEQLAVVLCVCGTVAFAQPPDERAAKVLADARAALGGEANLSAIKSFTTTGRTRRVQGENLVPIEFEMLVELPDKYLRKDEIPAQESDPTTIGFNGDALLQIPPPAPPTPRPGMPAPPPGQFEAMLQQRTLTARQDFARLMLGMFATSFQAYPLTFKYVGQAEAPQGKANVLEATGASNFKIRFFIDIQTNLPIMVSWTTPARPMPAGRGGPGAPSSPGAAVPPAAPPAPPAAPPSPPEQRLYFADYRDVDGIKLPFRLRRGVGVNTTEETTFDRFRLNQKIDPRRFEVRK